MSNIVLNQNSISNSRTNSELTYKFPRSVSFTETSEVVLSHCSIYYSWFNISKRNNNNFFQYRWWGTDPDAGLTEVIDVLIPDGYYTVGTLYEYFQSVMVANGHYLVVKNANGDFCYFINLSTIPTYYATEVRLSSLGPNDNSVAGVSGDVWSDVFQAPSGWAIPNTYQTPELIIPSNNKFGELLGFPSGTISITQTISQTINQSYNLLSSITPQMEPQASFIITCSLVKNDLATPSNVIASFSVPGSASIGDQINISNDIVWSKIAPGQYEEVRLQILDQNYEPLYIYDPNMLLVLSIR